METASKRKVDGVRLSREQWLSRALEILAKEGQSRLRLLPLVKKMGVSTGSFYWHFKNRHEFILHLVAYWDEEFTGKMIMETSAIEGTPEERLLDLMNVLLDREVPRYEVPIRALAALEPEVAQLVQDADEKRLVYIGSLFREMGFTDEELEMRTRLWLYYEMGQFTIYSKLPYEVRKKQLVRRHAFLTAR